MGKLWAVVPLLWAVWAAAAETPKTEGSKPDLKIGEAVWQNQCKTCHGIDGKGRASMARMFNIEPARLDLTQAAAQEKTENLAKIVADGKGGKMPAFKGKLKPAEMDAVVAYVKRLGSAKPAAGKK